LKRDKRINNPLSLPAWPAQGDVGPCLYYQRRGGKERVRKSERWEGLRERRQEERRMFVG